MRANHPIDRRSCRAARRRTPACSLVDMLIGLALGLFVVADGLALLGSQLQRKPQR